MSEEVLALLGAYLIGSVPAAWVLVRLATPHDLRDSGSRNIGALNASRVSGSRALGLVVLLLDGLKGAAAVALARLLGAQPGLGLVGVVAGHDYNLWLSLPARRLVGGKGFAAAAGALLSCMPWLVVVWLGVALLAWLVFRITRAIRDEAPATAVATLSAVPAAWLLHGGGAALHLAVVALLVLPKLAREVRDLLTATHATPQG